MLDVRPEVRAAPVARRPNPALEVGLIGALYAAYAWIRDTHGRAHDVGAAFAHGRAVMRAEHVLHLDPEHAVQRLIPMGGPAVHVVNGFYLVAHVTVTLSVLIFLYVRRPAIYRRCRNALVAISLASLVIFALYPTAPPRLLPAAHVRDTLVTGGWWSLNHGGIERIADPYAAMPSLHLGWSTWVALSLAAAFATSSRRVLFAAYPVLVTVVVLVTGAHWLLDAVAGAALALVAWWLSGRLPTADWASRPAPHGVQSVHAGRGQFHPDAIAVAVDRAAVDDQPW